MIILNKCACGILTNYGATCVNCSSAVQNNDESAEINVDFESLFTPDDTESEINVQSTSNDSDSPNIETDQQNSHPQKEEASCEKE